MSAEPLAVYLNHHSAGSTAITLMDDLAERIEGTALAANLRPVAVLEAERLAAAREAFAAASAGRQ